MTAKFMATFLALIAFFSLAFADLLADLDAGLVATCGENPTPGCAITYWLGAANQLATLAAQYDAFFDRPETQIWCGFYPWECQPILDDYQEVLLAWNYAESQV